MIPLVVPDDSKLYDLSKLPRPDRSGWIAVILFWVLSSTAGNIVNAPYMTGSAGWLETTACFLLPCSLVNFPRPPVPREKLSDHYNETVLTFNPNWRQEVVRKKDPNKCTCMFQIRSNDARYLWSSPALNGLVCHLGKKYEDWHYDGDLEPMYFEKEAFFWVSVPGNQTEVRWVCEK